VDEFEERVVGNRGTGSELVGVKVSTSGGALDALAPR